MFISHAADIIRALDSAASVLAFVLASVAFALTTWKRSALAVQSEVSDTYRQLADAQRCKCVDLENRLRRLDARVRALEFDRQRTEKKHAAARAEIEQFERIVRLFISARSTLRAETRAAIEQLLAEIAASREQFAADLFAWEQAYCYEGGSPHAGPHPASAR
jgi:chromosome segregation ATPase